MDVFGHGRNFGLQSRWGGGYFTLKSGCGVKSFPSLALPLSLPPPAAYALGTGSGGFSPEKNSISVIAIGEFGAFLVR